MSHELIYYGIYFLLALGLSTLFAMGGVGGGALIIGIYTNI